MFTEGKAHLRAGAKQFPKLRGSDEAEADKREATLEQPAFDGIFVSTMRNDDESGFGLPYGNVPGGLKPRKEHVLASRRQRAAEEERDARPRSFFGQGTSRHRLI